MKTSLRTRLIRFLQDELSISTGAIALAERALQEQGGDRQGEATSSLFPIVLWQYGLVTLEQVDRILDWLEAA